MCIHIYIYTHREREREIGVSENGLNPQRPYSNRENDGCIN